MGERQVRFVSVDEFMAWEADQAEKHELVDGVVRLMTGARMRHTRITLNVLTALRQRLRGRRCFPFNADTPVRTASGNVRRPDAGVDCGTYDDRQVFADKPTLVIEVLSERTRGTDEGAKLVEYMNTPGIQFVLHVAQDAPDVILIALEADGRWSATPIKGLDDVVVIPALDLTLPLAEIYEDVPFGAAPDD